jgi:hypothetical protein
MLDGKKKIVKRNSFFFFCLHLQSVAIANNFNSVTLYSAAANTINKKAMQEQEIYMDIERFFFCSFLSFSIDTFSSDQQTATLSAFFTLHTIQLTTPV